MMSCSERIKRRESNEKTRSTARSEKAALPNPASDSHRTSFFFFFCLFRSHCQKRSLFVWNPFLHLPRHPSTSSPFVMFALRTAAARAMPSLAMRAAVIPKTLVSPAFTARAVSVSALRSFSNSRFVANQGKQDSQCVGLGFRCLLSTWLPGLCSSNSLCRSLTLWT